LYWLQFGHVPWRTSGQAPIYVRSTSVQRQAGASRPLATRAFIGDVGTDFEACVPLGLWPGPQARRDHQATSVFHQQTAPLTTLSGKKWWCPHGPIWTWHAHCDRSRYDTPALSFSALPGPAFGRSRNGLGYHCRKLIAIRRLTSFHDVLGPALMVAGSERS